MTQAQRLLLLAAVAALILLLLPAAVTPRCKDCRRTTREEAVCAEALDTSESSFSRMCTFQLLPLPLLITVCSVEACGMIV